MKLKRISQPMIKCLAPDLFLYNYDMVTSTNDVLKKKAAIGVPSGTAVSAHAQTHGRGRLGRNFFSPTDTGLYLSILYRHDDMGEDPLTLTVHAAVAVSLAIEEVFGIVTKIKWVNDLYFHTKKCAGLLAEGIIRHNRLEAIILGVGINLWDPLGGFSKDIAQTACSLLGDGSIDLHLRQKLLTALHHHLYPLPMGPDVMALYRKRSMVIGKNVQLTGGGIPPITGVVETIRDDGALVLLTENEPLIIRSGEITLRLHN